MTKEELHKIIGEICESIYTLGWQHSSEVRSGLSRLQAEFERYIDVLEPLRKGLGTYSPNMSTRDYYKDVAGLLGKQYRFDCDFVGETLRRACDLMDAEKKPIQDEWKSPQAQEAILKHDLFQAQYRPKGTTEKMIIHDGNRIDTHYLTFINGVLTDYTLEGKTTGGTSCCQHGYVSMTYCPHCGKEVG